MTKVRVASFGMSLDGFSPRPDQDVEHPLGIDCHKVMSCFMGTRTFRAMQSAAGGTETEPDEEFERASFANVGAGILGRNKFGHVRGPCPDESRHAWLGDEPPYHVPVFVLRHHARAPLKMQGGTTLHLLAVLDCVSARDAAADSSGIARSARFAKASRVDRVALSKSSG